MNATIAILCLFSLSALLIGWDHFGRYRLPQPTAGALKLREVIVVLTVILLAPYLSLLLPAWAMATLLGLATVRPLVGYCRLLLAGRSAAWSLTLAVGALEVAAFVYGGAGKPLFFVVNNSIQVMAAVSIANLWAGRGLKARDAAIVSGALTLYVALFAMRLPVMDTLFRQLTALPFAPLMTWAPVAGQAIAIWRVDLIMAIVLPLVLRQEVGRKAGLVGLALNGLTVAGVLWLPALGHASLPLMIVLGPLLIGQVAFWRWWCSDLRLHQAIDKLVVSPALLGHFGVVAGRHPTLVYPERR